MTGILLICTNKYKRFVRSLLPQIDRYFLLDQKLTVFIFTDTLLDPDDEYGFDIVQVLIHPYRWPHATLYRYRIFTEHEQILKGCNYLFYLDVDMGIVAPVGKEILGSGLTVVRHPGFYISNGWGSQNVHPESKAFVPETGRQKYFAGGFQGGATKPFLAMCRTLADNIADDERRGIIAEHNDESHLNHYLWANPQIPRIELDSGYCMVEESYLRQNWGISHLTPRIIALTKNHQEVRA